MSRIPRGLALAAALLAAPGQRAAAQWSDDTVPGLDVRVARELAATLMSPYCPGYTIEQCPSPAADTLRRWMRARLAAGDSPAAIEESLVVRFGEGVRGAPRAHGFALWLWAFPPAGILLAGWLALRRVREASRCAVVRPPPVLDAAAERRVAEELAALEQ